MHWTDRLAIAASVASAGPLQASVKNDTADQKRTERRKIY